MKVNIVNNLEKQWAKDEIYHTKKINESKGKEVNVESIKKRCIARLRLKKFNEANEDLEAAINTLLKKKEFSQAVELLCARIRCKLRS